MLWKQYAVDFGQRKKLVNELDIKQTKVNAMQQMTIVNYLNS